MPEELDLGWEYAQNVVIDGKSFALDFVDSHETATESVIRRRFIGEGGERRWFEKRTAKAKVAARPAPVVPPKAKEEPGPAPKPVEMAPTATEELDLPAAEAPTTAPEPKRGFFSKLTGKGKKKGK